MKTSLRERILAYHKRNPGVWIPKGEVLRLVQERTTYTADNAGRRLRELREDGILKQKLIKGHAHYRYNKRIIKVPEVYVVDGIAYEKLIEKVV